MVEVLYFGGPLCNLARSTQNQESDRSPGWRVVCSVCLPGSALAKVVYPLKCSGHCEYMQCVTQVHLALQAELFDLFAERLAKKLGELEKKKPQE